MLKINKNYNASVDPLKQETFIEFVEKLVILDLITRSWPLNFLEENFLKIGRFPYDPRGFLGYETALLNVVTFWNHYRKKYSRLLASKVVVTDDELLQYQKEMGTRFEDSQLSEDEQL